jgi:hypothetical protein
VLLAANLPEDYGEVAAGRVEDLHPELDTRR